MPTSKVHCDQHGETEKTYVCSHLAVQSHALGFNSKQPTKRTPYPDAWCDDCELVRAAHGGWNDTSESLVSIKLLCAECYERTRIRNTKSAETLDDLANLRWKCGSCEEWHSGPMLDVGFDRPYYWSAQRQAGTRWAILPSGELEMACSSFLDLDFCAIDNEYFFIRGVLPIPIRGSAEDFCWGVWGSLSLSNFEMLLRAEACGTEENPAPMFSWLSTKIPNYPDTLNLAMHLHIQDSRRRPIFFHRALRSSACAGISPGNHASARQGTDVRFASRTARVAALSFTC